MIDTLEKYHSKIGPFLFGLLNEYRKALFGGPYQFHKISLDRRNLGVSLFFLCLGCNYGVSFALAGFEGANIQKLFYFMVILVVLITAGHAASVWLTVRFAGGNAKGHHRYLLNSSTLLAAAVMFWPQVIVFMELAYFNAFDQLAMIWDRQFRAYPAWLPFSFNAARMLTWVGVLFLILIYYRNFIVSSARRYRITAVGRFQTVYSVISCVLLLPILIVLAYVFALSGSDLAASARATWDLFWIYQ